MYRVHETQETITLAELEENSRRFASVLVKDFDVAVGDAVTIFALNSVSICCCSHDRNHRLTLFRFTIQSLSLELWRPAHRLHLSHIKMTWMRHLWLLESRPLTPSY
jgi:hypothetical protein